MSAIFELDASSGDCERIGCLDMLPYSTMLAVLQEGVCVLVHLLAYKLKLFFETTKAMITV